MDIKCDYCGRLYPDVEEICPACGAPNPCRKTAEGIPQTIEELKAFAEKHNLPLAKMRFFLGEDFKQPKAFGIFKNEQGECVVYKTKADGSRAIRYQGKDEAYAVNEIYQKMRTEIQQQREMRAKQSTPVYNSKPATKPSYNLKPTKQFKIGDAVDDFLTKVLNSKVVSFFLKLFDKFFEHLTELLILFVIADIIFGIWLTFFCPKDGYYDYQDALYYCQDNSWYVYSDDCDDWLSASIDDELDKHYKDYYKSEDYFTGYDGSDFSNSSYYKPSSERSGSDNDWDYDWDDDWDDDDWDIGSDWDSGFTDWDSDW